MAMPEDLVLVRHGQSEANIVQKQFREDPYSEAPDGFTDRHDTQMRLSHLGRKQAAKAGEWLLENFPDGFDKYYASPLTRTVETAARLAINGSWRLDDRWRERDWGEFGTLSEPQQIDMYEMSHRLRQQHKWYWCPPGGESLATGVRMRFRDILDTLHRDENTKSMIAVTHGELIEAARFELEYMIPDQWLEQSANPAYKIENCQVLHYTRNNPVTGEVQPRIQWMRAVCPWDETKSWRSGEWQEIPTRKVFSDEELLERAERVEPLFKAE
jgi:broad specificity phosphatase PhoE